MTTATTTADHTPPPLMRRLVGTALSAAALALAVMTVTAPAAYADAKSDCENQGGTYTDGTITDPLTGKTKNVGTCCIKNVATGDTKCTQTVLTNAQDNPIQPPRRPGLPIVTAPPVSDPGTNSPGKPITLGGPLGGLP